MASIEPAATPKEKTTQRVGDWLAPIIAFLVVVGILLALVSALFESAR